MNYRNFVEMHNIVKRYAAHTALNGVSMSVEEGKIFGLLGPNGAGKTTLIRILNRITAADSGEIYFNGHPLYSDDIYNIGYLPEERGLYRKMKVGEQAIYLAQLKGMSKSDARKQLKYWFEKFDIEQWWDKKLEELSKGMQQKVQFIITVLHKPELLIFDEPFSGFDPVNAELLKREILELKKQGHTIIFSTHNMASVEEICDNIALINHSEVVLQGEVPEIRSRFKTNIYQIKVLSGRELVPDSRFTIRSAEQNNREITYLIQKDNSISNSELLRYITEKNEVVSFTELLPSMNEIFINIVGEENKR